MLALFERLTRAAEKRDFSVALVLGAVAWVASLRMLGERIFSMGAQPLTRAPMPWFTHIFGFYLALLCVLGAVLARVVPVDWRRAQNLVAMGLLMGVTPPLIDSVAVGVNTFSYEYRPGAGKLPWLLSGDVRVLPPGETFILWCSVVMMGVYAGRRSRSWLRGAAASGLTYALVLVFLVGAPTVSALLSSRTGLAPSEWRVVLFALFAELGLVVTLRLELRALQRLPQVALPVLFCLAGAALRGSLSGPAFVVASHFALVGMGFALSNDWYDREEDALRGPPPRIDAQGAALLSVVPLTGALGLMAFRVEAGLCVLAFAVVAHAYQADPLRLKCVFPLSYKTEGLLAGAAMLGGISCDPGRLPVLAEVAVAAVVALGTPAALVFKDYKDVDGDAAAGVKTAFVFAESRGWSRERMRLVAAVLLMVSLAVAAVWLLRQSRDGVAVAVAGVIAVACLLAIPKPRLAVVACMVSAELGLAAVVWSLARSS